MLWKAASRQAVGSLAHRALGTRALALAARTRSPTKECARFWSALRSTMGTELPLERARLLPLLTFFDHVDKVECVEAQKQRPPACNSPLDLPIVYHRLCRQALTAASTDTERLALLQTSIGFVEQMAERVDSTLTLPLKAAAQTCMKLAPSIVETSLTDLYALANTLLQHHQKCRPEVAGRLALQMCSHLIGNPCVHGTSTVCGGALEVALRGHAILRDFGGVCAVATVRSCFFCRVVCHEVSGRHF